MAQKRREESEFKVSDKRLFTSDVSDYFAGMVTWQASGQAAEP